MAGTIKGVVAATGAENGKGTTMTAETTRTDAGDATTTAVERLWNVRDVGRLLGITPRAVYKLVAARRIPYCKPTPAQLRFDPGDVRAWLESRTVRPLT